MQKEVIYNVTVQPDEDIATEWLEWMKNIHIPEVMETGCFTSSRICRMVIPAPEGGSSFTIQYTCTNMAILQRYQAIHAPRLQKDHIERYKDRFVAFRTIVEVEWEST